MAQVDKAVAPEREILAWNLWAREKPATVKAERADYAELYRLGRPAFAYGLLALAVMLPLLWPGFILTLDMAFTPELRMPEHMSSSYLFHALLHYLNLVLPSDVIQKIMLFLILLLSGIGLHFLVRHIQSSKDRSDEFALWGAYIAGALYMINPFTYSRFMAGQYAVLLGYALLPFFVRALMRFFAVPTLKRSLVAAGWLTAIGVVSVHTLGLAAILMLAALATCVWRCRRNRAITMAAVAYGLAGIGLFLLASGYWLVPLALGSSNQGQAITQFTNSDQEAFATAGEGAVGKLGNILQLQGFWAEAEGLYLLPQDQLPGWGLVVLAIWSLIVIGAVWVWRNQRTIAILFIFAGLAATVVAITGTGNLPLLAGFREPHKFIGLLALVYALFAGLGAAAILRRVKQKYSANVFGIAAVLVVLLPVLFTPTMLWGFAGQLSPRHYPADWYAMNDRFNQDGTDFRVLSLPWHLYMHYQFAGRVIVNPSDKFFDKPVITSNELEFMGASPTFPNTTKKMLSEAILPGAAQKPDLGMQLQELNIKYVLLAKTYDYKDYQYLDNRADLKLISETPNLKLYRNLSYE